MTTPEELEDFALAKLRDRKYLLSILEIIKGFIHERGLILYGGQAIDYALRLRDSKLYSDLEIPDYDFYSQNHVEDAYDLVDILTERGYEFVSAIRAKHPQTMRVRVGINVVADIGYITPLAFAEVKKHALEYNGMLVRSPYDQMVDILRQLSHPLDGFPRSSYKARSSKDLKRFDMLIEKYPLNALNIPAKGPPLKKTAVTVANPCHQVLGGCLAYCAFYADYLRLKLPTEGILPASITHTDTGFEAEIVGHPILIIFEAAQANPKDTFTNEWYAPYMDNKPPSVIAKSGIEYWLTTYLYILVAKWGNHYVMSLEGLLSYFLQRSVDTPLRSTYGPFLISLMRMVDNIAKHRAPTKGTVFSPAARIMGCKNRPLETGFYPEIKDILPQEYHASNDRPEPFQYTSIFKTDGTKTSKDCVVIY